MPSLDPPWPRRRCGPAAALLGALAFLAQVSPAQADAPCPPDLRIAFHDGAFPPMLMGRGGRFEAEPGWLVRATRAALVQLGCSAELVRLPSRRLELELQQGQLGFGLLVGATPERLARLRFPRGADGQPDRQLTLVRSRLALFALPASASAAAWSGQRLPPAVRVGAVHGTTQMQVAQAQGWTVTPVAQFDNAIAMLRAQRFDLLLANPEVLPAQVLQGPDGLQELQPPVQEVLYYAPASPDIWRQHPAFVRRFWQALCEALPRQGAAACGG